MNKSVKIAVVGASGYTGMELLRLLLMHPNAELCCVTSRQYAGQALADVFPRYRSAAGAELAFSEPDAESIAATGAELAFLALPHGVAADYATALLDLGIKVIDLSADFRLSDPAVYEEFYGAPHPAPELLKEAVYGFPEIRSAEIAKARLIASPGCYPTSVSLPLIPMLAAKLIDPQSIVTCSMSGVSGAGKTGNVIFSYCEANESARAYSVPKHRHLSEIEQELSIAAAEKVTMSFTPHLIPTHNGICSTSSAKFIGDETDLAKVDAALTAAYGDSYFVRLLGKGNPADTKNVTRTNHIDIGWDYDSRTGRLLLLSAEDNLGKGAGGQAIQCFNIMFGLDETAGLKNY
ncbi:MAG: N-acetyl-gamma-glutamyl-phosphate reductase [Rubritalea sp.]|jgi:N-acetyl-gamma-glutamyl-phosphate reductase|tara:strand:- start:4969 stop:6018 length:1050 start_codon:yes stop_codon:yes gene_type:complete